MGLLRQSRRQAQTAWSKALTAQRAAAIALAAALMAGLGFAIAVHMPSPTETDSRQDSRVSDLSWETDEALRLSRAREVAELVENLDQVRKAQVVYPDLPRRTLFGAIAKKTACAVVTTERGIPLSQKSAETIILLIAAASTGLDPCDVLVSDQAGNRYSIPPCGDTAERGESGTGKTVTVISGGAKT